MDGRLVRSVLLYLSLLPLLLLAACWATPTPYPSACPTCYPWPDTCTPAPGPFCSPAPAFTSTPAPTLAPGAVAATVEASQAQARAAGVEPLCMRYEDTDADGQPEWVGLYIYPGPAPELRGFVLDTTSWYDLRPPESEEAKGLGEIAACEMEIRDLNADGRVEIVVWGHTQTGADLLHIFVWEGTRYALLGGFEGKGGIRLENTDGDLAEEVVVRWRPEGDLVWEVVYTWDGAHYAWTWDRYDWFYLDRPHAYLTDSPLHALACFYLALDDRDLPGAYGLLSPQAQAARPYSEWASGFHTTLGAEVGAARVVSQAGSSAAVVAQVRALDNLNGRVIATVYSVEWQLMETAAGWRLESGTSQLLEQWEVRYYP